MQWNKKEQDALLTLKAKMEAAGITAERGYNVNGHECWFEQELKPKARLKVEKDETDPTETESEETELVN